MTVVVNLRSPDEEKVLLAFLDSLQYDYKNVVGNTVLTEEQQKEIIRRDTSFAEGKTNARNWDEILKELEHVYR